MGFLKVWGWAVGRTLNKVGKKIEIFQSSGVGRWAGMGRSAAKYGNILCGIFNSLSNPYSHILALRIALNKW